MNVPGIITIALALISTQVLAGDLQVRFTDRDGNPVRDAVIEITAPAAPIPDDWEYRGVMDQLDKEFKENVITVQKLNGQPQAEKLPGLRPNGYPEKNRQLIEIKFSFSP